MMYLYIESEPGLYTVGCEINGKWCPESDHASIEAAVDRMRVLNGVSSVPTEKQLSGKICPLSFISDNQAIMYCEKERCAWWNDDFGACSINALAQVFTRPIATVDGHCKLEVSNDSNV